MHTYADMVLARMLMISAGYEDCDDIDALRADPALKLACGRCPESGADLMSQPTLSRLENLAHWRALARIGMGLIDLFCRSFAHAPDRICTASSVSSMSSTDCISGHGLKDARQLAKIMLDAPEAAASQYCLRRSRV